MSQIRTRFDGQFGHPPTFPDFSRQHSRYTLTVFKRILHNQNMNLLENSGSHGNPPVSTDVKPLRVKREAVVPRTTKNYQNAVGKIQWTGVY